MTFTGWMIVLLINDKTLKRAEVSRIKDNLITKIDFLHQCLEAHLLKQELNAIQLEKLSVAKSAQIEFYINQLNSMVGFKLISIKKHK